MAKEGLIARQFMLGVVQTAEGLPIYRGVRRQCVGDEDLMPTLSTVLERFPRCAGSSSSPTGAAEPGQPEALQTIRVANGQALEFIIAVPGRRYHEFADVLGDFHRGAL